MSDNNNDYDTEASAVTKLRQSRNLPFKHKFEKSEPFSGMSDIISEMDSSHHWSRYRGNKTFPILLYFF